MKVAVIPARGGSKRIPRKNIRDFLGKPMITYPLAVLQQANCFDRILVSTDDEEIAAIAKEYGAEVPFMRPKELADDYAGTIPVIAHATQWCIDQGMSINAICCIYATNPFLQVDDIKQGLAKLQQGNWSYAFSVTEYAAPIFRAFQQTESGGVEMFFPQNYHQRSQDLPKALHDAAQFYWGSPEAWLSQKSLFASWSAPIFIPRWRVQDLDTLDDWQRAELLFKLIHNL